MVGPDVGFARVFVTIRERKARRQYELAIGTMFESKEAKLQSESKPHESKRFAFNVRAEHEH